MRIVWHGHSCFEFRDDTVSVVVDPHDGKSLGIQPPSVSAKTVLMTHPHYDHSASRVVRGSHHDIMERNGRFNSNGLEVTGFSLFHDDVEGKKHGTNTIYRFTVGGLSVCHCGDLGAIPPLKIIERMRSDILIVPAGEVTTLDMKGIEEFIDVMSPRVVVPMHYHVCGLSMPLRNLDRFLDMAGDADYIGQEIDISESELSKDREYWVFSR